MAKELPDGENAPAMADGNFIIGPTHNPAPELTVHEGVPQGTVYNFIMESTDSKTYPGIAREPRTTGTASPVDPAKRIVISHPAPYTRRVAVYVPKQYVPGTDAPFIVGADGPDQVLFTVLDNLIWEKKVPVMVAVSIGNGSGDAQGSERGLEYDTMSGLYAEFVEKEVLPLVEKQYNVKLTKDPEGRATMGGSSGEFLRVNHGLVSSRAVPPRPHLFRQLCELAVAGESGNAAWRTGVSRELDSPQPAQADPAVDGGGRSRPLYSRPYAERSCSRQ